MTNPVILLGTQSNGETLPVQVDATGRLVAEGLPGPDGPQGPPGPEGPAGPSFELPPDPYEGALLGWLNGELSWVGTPPVPIAPGVFGPITSWNAETGTLEVAGEIPASVGNGVYLEQCEADGTLYMQGYNPLEDWSDYGTGTPNEATTNWNKAFNLVRGVGDDSAFAGSNQTMTWTKEMPVLDKVSFSGYNPASPGTCGVRVNGSLWLDATVYYDDIASLTAAQLGGTLNKVELINSNLVGPYINGIQVDGKWLIDTEWSLQFRVQLIVGQALVGSAVNGVQPFEVGKYLKIPEQRVAPWVLYGNDPAGLSDHLRSD